MKPELRTPWMDVADSVRSLRASLGMIASLFVNGIVGVVIWLSSNKLLFAGIIVITIWWISFNAVVPHPFDDPRQGYVKLVLWYTIIFGIWEGAQKVVQAQQIKRDHAIQELIVHDIELSKQSLNTVTELVVAIREQLDMAKDRDQMESERTLTLIALVERLLEAHDKNGRV